MFCVFRAGGGVCEQAIHECARRCVLEAAPQGEECGRKNGAHFFRGFSIISPRSTALSASLMVRLILVFLTRH